MMTTKPDQSTHNERMLLVYYHQLARELSAENKRLRTALYVHEWRQRNLRRAQAEIALEDRKNEEARR